MANLSEIMLIAKAEQYLKVNPERFTNAEKEKFKYFTTTLSLSPYKDAEWINDIGGSLSEKYNSNFLYSDFKKKNGYKRSIELSKEYNLYRQDYCGCVYSLRDKIND